MSRTAVVEVMSPRRMSLRRQEKGTSVNKDDSVFALEREWLRQELSDDASRTKEVIRVMKGADGGNQLLEQLS